MEQNWNSNVLKIQHIREPAKAIVQYIDDRRKGNTKSLKTRWLKFNRQCMGGIEPNVIYTIAGISGSGKSSFANSLETDLFDLNKDIEFTVLSFNLEMLSSKQVGRKLSYRLSKTTSELYSSTDNKLSDKEYESVIKTANDLSNYPIYYVDTPGTVDQIEATIKYFRSHEKFKNTWLVIMFDHTLLTKNKTGETERATLADLQRLFMEIKKQGKTTIIQLSQLNREIEETSRITNPSQHYPIRRDIFGGDSVFHSSDYVIVIHRPEILGLTAYGPKNWPVNNLIYMHFLKVREGEPKILVFENNLKYNRIDDYNP